MKGTNNMNKLGEKRVDIMGGEGLERVDIKGG